MIFGDFFPLKKNAIFSDFWKMADISEPFAVHMLLRLKASGALHGALVSHVL